ncbi:MAG: DUF6110 family protein [Oscillospiraceae bacterium]
MGIISFCTNKKVLAFLGGIATATIGVKILKSAPVRKAAVSAMAGGMKLRDDAMSTFETIKEDAQDLYHEARQQSAPGEGPTAAPETDE